MNLIQQNFESKIKTMLKSISLNMIINDVFKYLFGDYNFRKSNPLCGPSIHNIPESNLSAEAMLLTNRIVWLSLYWEREKKRKEQYKGFEIVINHMQMVFNLNLMFLTDDKKNVLCWKVNIPGLL